MAYVRKTPVGRESWYELREPLLRMVIEVKRGRGEPIRLIVDFLRRWYNRRERQQRLSFASSQHPLTREYLTASLDLELAVQDPPDWERARQFSSDYAKCLEGKQFDRACEIAAEIIERKGTACNADDWFQYGYCLNETEQYEAALLIWEKVVRGDPNNAASWNNRGSALANLGDYSAALTSYDKALSLDPNYALHWFNHAEAQLALGRWGEFFEDIDRGFAVQSVRDNWFWDTKEYCRLLLRAEGFQDKVGSLTAIYAKHDALGALGQWVTESIPEVLEERVSQTVAEQWLAAWQSARGESTELEIPLWLLAAAVEWKKTRSIRALLALPIEERRILESLLPEAEA